MRTMEKALGSIHHANSIDAQSVLMLWLWENVMHFTIWRVLKGSL